MNRIVAATAVFGFAWICGPVRGQKEKPVDAAAIEMLRVVADKDGFTNVRSGPSADARVTGKLAAGTVVTTPETKGEWSRIDDDSGAERALYVHSSRLKKLDGWKEFSGSHEDPGKGSVKAGTMEVEVGAAPFVEKDHKITKDKGGMIRVDGRRPWGTDGGLPHKSLSLAVKLNGKPVIVPSRAVSDLYEPGMDSLVLLTPGKAEEQAVVAMWNSDGAGGYLIAWSFVAGKYTGRAILVP